MRVDRVNLLPKNLRPSRVNARSGLAAGWVVCVLTMLIGVPLELWSVQKNEARSIQVAQAAQVIDAKLQEAQRIAEQANKTTLRISQSQEFLASKVMWTGALKELSLLIPKTVWLTNFSLKSGDHGPYIEVIGSAASQDKIASFLNSLETSYYFHDVNLRKSEKVATITPDLYKFELEVVLPQLVAGGSHEKAK